MSRRICPYSEEQMVCIPESIGETDIDCDKCWVKKEEQPKGCKQDRK